MEVNMKEITELDDMMEYVNSYYDSVFHMGEVFYIDKKNKVAYMIGSYYDDNDEKHYRLEEIDYEFSD